MRISTPLESLQRIAVLIAIAVGGVLAWEHVANHDPDNATYQAASDAFGARQWEKAHALFAELASDDTLTLAARRGQANSLVQLAKYDEAYAVMNSVISDEPDNACNYATRGIVADHMGAHLKAMRDYARAVSGCPAAIHGMSWFKRLLTNTHQRPPTVADRLNYLRVQMELPEDQRVLSLPAMDRAQKPWTT